MGFYAKGSPGTVLHLTEQSDARGGITDDTIFHSSLPHIFVEKEWEIPFNSGVYTDWTTGSRWGKFSNISGSFGPFTDHMRSKFNTMVSGDIPWDLSNAMSDNSKVLIFELVFNDGGTEYKKIVNGLSLGNSGVLACSRTQESGNHKYSVRAKALTKCVISPGIGVTLGLAKWRGNWMATLGNPESYGTNAYLHVGETAVYNLWGNDPWGHRDALYSRALGIHWLSRYSGSVTAKLDVAAWFRYPYTPNNSWNKFVASPMATDIGLSVFYGESLDMTVYPDRYEYRKSAANYDGSFVTTLNNKYDSNNTSSRGISAPRFMEDVPREWDRNRVSNTMDGCFIPQLYYNRTPVKVRVKQLNISYNKQSGYTIHNILPSNGEIRIGGGRMSIGGVDIQSIGKKLIYQINSLQGIPSNRDISYSNSSYTNLTMPWESQVMFADRASNNNLGVINLGGNTSPSRDFSLSFAPIQGTGWGCTPNTIFNSSGNIWSANYMPLTLRNNSTVTFNIGGQTGNINSSNTTGMVVQQTIHMGLSTSRPTSILFKIHSTDPSLAINGNSWYSLGNSDNVNQCLQTQANNVEVESTHGLLVLPINEAVPVIVSSGVSAHLYDNYARSGDYHEQLSSIINTVFWFKNLGNGSLQVLSTHSSHRNPTWIPAFRGSNYYVAMPPTNNFKVPNFTLNVVKLS